MKYRKKQIEVEALQIDSSPEEIVPGFTQNEGSVAWISGWMLACDFSNFDIWTENGLKGFVIKTPEGEMIAQPGDWIIRGVKGEFYPCKSDIFEATYELVEE